MLSLSRISRYILLQFLSIFIIAIAVGLFIGSIATTGKLLSLFREGQGSLVLILQFFLYMMPKLAIYIIPVTLQISVVLLFNRLSANREIVALRSAGVSLFHIITPILLITMLISALLAYIHFQITPVADYQLRVIVKQEVVKNPLQFLEPGFPSAIFPGFYILLGKKDGNRIYDIHIYKKDAKTHKLVQNITASEGQVDVDPIRQKMKIRLVNATIVKLTPDDPTHASHRILAAQWSEEFDYGSVINRKPLVRRVDMMTFGQLLSWLTMATAAGGKIGLVSEQEILFEIHSRTIWAIAPLSLVLLGIPFGIFLSRQETAAGLLAAVILAGVYYLPMTFISRAIPLAYHPEWLMWGLTFLFQGCGLWLLWKQR
ncbi:MAG: YjgP/YjgQ family permease [Lentisphaerae bacterium]|nr:MAG: YjgP/YjgQ family permease [Lentisphaerota bacterium]